ncbi:MAG: DUF3426 domain-containing protein [Burkholderiales bacterium]|nr:DUF3426 domain-containing protein [Burkholderiales bacterium]
MALATRCPQCGTTFKVAHDQLKLRAGMVRCGACKQVFNGIEHLVRNQADEVVTVGAPAAAPTTPAPVTPVPAAPIPPAATPPAPTAPVATPAPPPLATPAPTAPPPTATPSLAPVPPPATPTPTTAPVLELVPTPAPAPTEWPTLVTDSMFVVHEEIIAVPHEDFDEDFDLPPPEVASAPAAVEDESEIVTVHTDLHLDPIAAVQEAQQERLQETQVETRAETIAQPTTPVVAPEPALRHDAVATPHLRIEPQLDDAVSTAQAAQEDANLALEANTAAAVESDAEEPEFVIQGRKRQGLRRVLHLVLVLTTLGLFVGALGQAAYAFRSQLAALAPPTKPWLEKGCQLLGCQVGFPSQIKAVALESDELQVLPHTRNVYALSTLLRNHSNTVQSWPYIELSLNDANDKALARRVFSPHDYLVNPQDEARGFVAHGEQLADTLYRSRIAANFQ